MKHRGSARSNVASYLQGLGVQTPPLQLSVCAVCMSSPECRFLPADRSHAVRQTNVSKLPLEYDSHPIQVVPLPGTARPFSRWLGLSSLHLSPPNLSMFPGQSQEMMMLYFTGGQVFDRDRPNIPRRCFLLPGCRCLEACAACERLMDGGRDQSHQNTKGKRRYLINVSRQKPETICLRGFCKNQKRCQDRAGFSSSSEGT